MNFGLLVENLSNPALLFFLFGIIAVMLKSDLQIPESSSKFISLYLLFSIGFKGGHELAHAELGWSVFWTVLFALATSVLIPIYSFFILKGKLGSQNAGAIAASYGSISAVTFITAVSFLELQKISFGGHMVAIMAMLEAPAIMVGVLLLNMYKEEKSEKLLDRSVVSHAFTNGSVLLILGSLVIGWIASDSQAKGIEPFTTDIFKGFLAIFLLDMGISSGKKLGNLFQHGKFIFAFSILMPLFNGVVVSILSGLITSEVGDRFLLSILSASASYIAVPAAMKIAAPKANPSLYLPMALAITFPFNITLGFPVYMKIIEMNLL
ncbi:sodium-dependent bicarbonate transport family permease [Marivirga harenae]|uniref:sodium-dependent bicarbonate transport family permease n=1 Tax=Marivirga harenae TaxID=2010992 RepID=UPI0026E09286|nr:sodium-dependent bicarbonate transport family permease [Marivirga harenae]WKV11598.1 sodium-dependent bicarbonate transport family permease [Marivirga harenae]|tara:strand:+ start:90979 stop:91947 length:969 start_codon:yes stop_codon:yes gene_type:complete